MTETKLCPLKRGCSDDFLVFKNVSVDEEMLTKIRETGAIITNQKDDKEPKVELILGKCDGPCCVWWSAERNCCGVIK